MDSFELIKKLNTQDWFKKLPYGDQVKVRELTLKKKGAEDPRWSKLSEGQAKLLYQNLLYAPPAMENPDQYKELIDIGKSLTRGDPEAWNDLKGYTFTKDIMENLTLVRAGSWIAHRLVGGEGATDFYVQNFGKESQKVEDYLKSVASLNPDRAERIKNNTVFGGILGTAMDMVGTSVGMGGAGATYRAISGGTSMATDVVKNLPLKGRIGAFLTNTVTPSVAEAASEGVFGVIRETLAARSNTVTPLNPVKEDGSVDIGQTLLDYAALDLLWTIPGRVAFSHIKGLIGAFNRKKKLAKFAKSGYQNMTEKDFNIMEKAYTAGKVAPETFNQLPEYLQDHFNSLDTLMKYKDMPVGNRMAIPEARAVEAGWAVQYRVLKTPEGKFKIRDWLDINKVEVVDSIDDVMTKVGNRAQMLADDIGDDFWHSFAQNFPDIALRTETVNATRASVDLSTFKDRIKDPNIKKQFDRYFETPKRVPVGKRPYISTTEADNYIAAGIGKRYHIDIDLPDDVTKAVKSIEAEDSIKLSTTGSGKGVFISPVSIASKADVDEALQEVAQLANKSDLRNPLHFILRNKGFDAIAPDNWNGKSIPNKIEYLYPTEAKLISNFVDDTGRLSTKLTDLKPAQRSPLKNTITVLGKVAGETPTPNDSLIVSMASRIAGDVDVEKIRNLASVYLKRFNVDTGNLKITKNADWKGEYMLHKSGDSYELRVPEKINDVQSHQEFMKVIFQDLQDYADANRTGKRVGRAITEQRFDRIYEKNRARFTLPVEGIDKEAWVTSMITRDGGKVVKNADGSFEALIPGTTRPEMFRDVDDLLDTTVLHNVSEKELALDLRLNGLTLKKVDDGYEVFGRGKTSLYKSSTLPDLMKRMGYRPDKFPAEMGPTVAHISPDGGMAIKGQGKIVSGSKEKVLKYLDGFRDYSEVEKLKRIQGFKDANLYRKTFTTYQVRMPKAGIIEEFKTVPEARDFINNWTQFENLKKIGRKKQLDVTYQRGRYEIADEGKVLYASSEEDLTKIFKAYPDPEYAPELFPEFRQAINSEELPPNMFPNQMPLYTDPPVFRKRVTKNSSITPLQSILNAITPADATIRRLSKTSGHTELLTLFREMDNYLGLANAEISRGFDISSQIFRVNGKLLDQNKRQGIQALLEATTDEIKDKVIKTFNLTPEDLGVADKVISMYDDLKYKFGVDPWKWLQNYAPHIRDWIRNPANKIPATSEELIDAVFGSRARTDPTLKFFALFDRSGDMAEHLRDMDSLSTLLKYQMAGHKKLYVGGTWDKISAYMKANAKTIPVELRNRIDRYRGLVSGQYKVPGVDGVKQFSRRVKTQLKHLGFVKDGNELDLLTDDLLQTFFTLNYTASMGLRPYLAIRNSLQVWTTLAPRFGFSNTARAIKNVGNMTPEAYDALLKKGVISGKAPIVNETLGRESKLGRFAERSMRLFTSSDEFTRAVAYHTAKVQFDDALDQWNRGRLKTLKGFSDTAGINLIDEDVSIRVMDAFQKYTNTGDHSWLETARDLFGKRVSDETMFMYRREMQPSLYSGSLIGKMFGQYGTYAPQYIENVARGLRRGNPAQRLAFLTRWVGAGSALYYAFEAFDIRGKDYLPWGPMGFSGGAVFDALMQLRSLPAGGYEGRQALGELKYMVKGFVPGSYQVKMVSDAIKFFQEGDSYKAMLSLTGAPIRMDTK